MAISTLKIVVVSGDKSEKSYANTNVGSDNQKSSGKSSKLYKLLNFNQTIKSKFQKATSPTTFYAIQSGVGLATQTARQFINYYVSDIGRSTGDSNYQAIVNRRIEQITDATSMLGGALGGGAAGSAMGPVGAVLGAVVGVASSGINLVFKYKERDRAYQHEIFQENNSQAYQLARANYSALTGRVR